jgi:geranylgeranyl diphosphate synthase, type II
MHSLNRLQQIFQKYLDENQFLDAPVELYHPVNYILNLGGKRLRPIMLLMAYNLFREDIEIALPAAFSIEIFHNFSLLHDDIMDQAPLRRGMPSVHIKYNTNAGILSGDVMLIYAYKYLMKVENQKCLIDLVDQFSQVAVEVCEGQQYDMNFEAMAEVSISEYLKMISLKTGVLLGGAMKMGAIIADSSEKDAQLIYTFGKNVGIAFQLQDDILDTFGDPQKFGKRVGGDIIQNKKTYLVLRALELADDSTKANLKSLLSETSKEETLKINEVTKIFNRLNIQAEAEQIKEHYLQKALDSLDEVSVTDNDKVVLRGLADKLMKREV